MDLIDRIITAITQTHPLHPMLVHFPIALSGAALLFIIIAMVRKNNDFEKFAFANMVLTVFGVIAAGASGMYDNQANYLGDAPNASLKITLAVVMLAITLITVALRIRNREIFSQPGRLIYIMGYFISFGLALVLAFLGGVILYGF
jgi:uncharacterized membrane protein